MKKIILLFLAFVNINFAATLSGKIINASRDSLAVTNHPVFLLKMASGDMMPKEVEQKKTSSKGTYTFTFSNPDSGVSYFAGTDFSGIRFYSNDQNAKNQRIVVYDTTNSTSSLSTMMHHFIIDDQGKSLHFRETRVVNNKSKKAATETFTHPKFGKGTFEYPMPKNITNFQPTSNHFSGEMMFDNGKIFDKSIYLPGNKQISFTYQAHFKDRIDLVYTIPMATQSFDIFTSSASINLVSPRLKDMGDFTIRGQSYHRFNASDIAAGTQIPISISRSVKVNESPYLTVILTSILLLSVLVISVVRKRI